MWLGYVHLNRGGMWYEESLFSNDFLPFPLFPFKLKMLICSSPTLSHCNLKYLLCIHVANLQMCFATLQPSLKYAPHH
jgi:hypothetical protein